MVQNNSVMPSHMVIIIVVSSDMSSHQALNATHITQWRQNSFSTRTLYHITHLLKTICRTQWLPFYIDRPSFMMVLHTLVFLFVLEIAVFNITYSVTMHLCSQIRNIHFFIAALIIVSIKIYNNVTAPPLWL